MAKEIRISIKSGFDPSGINEASKSIDRLLSDLAKTNAEISQAIHNRASEVGQQRGQLIDTVVQALLIQ